MNDEPSSRQEPDSAADRHELRSNFNMRIGKSISLQASARITPVGIVAAGVATLCVALAVVALSPNLKTLANRTSRSRRRP
jgi:hypothetical protein